MTRQSWFGVALLLALAPTACTDLLGLEPGVLAQAGNASDGGGGANDDGGGNAARAGVDTGGAGAAGSSSGSAAVSGGSGGSAAGHTALELGGAAGADTSTLPDAGEPSTGPCSHGTCTECPNGMKQAFSKDAFAYCIDAAEVTNEQYLAFTQSHTLGNVEASTACLGNSSLVPDSDCSSALTDVPSRKLPVVCVDYCDAEAYCTTQGKRLCGRVGGAMNDPADVADPAADEWYAACAGPGESIYPYGNAASASQCNGSGYDPADPGPRDVATLSDCEGGIAGLFNMSGNVAEWEWSCSSKSAGATCVTRGGSFNDGPYELRCSGNIGLARLEASRTVGFRCCANLKN